MPTEEEIKEQEEKEKEEKKKKGGIILPDLDIEEYTAEDSISLSDINIGGYVEEPTAIDLSDLNIEGYTGEAIAEEEEEEVVEEVEEVEEEQLISVDTGASDTLREELSKYQTTSEFESAVRKGEVSEDAYNWYKEQAGEYAVIFGSDITTPDLTDPIALQQQADNEQEKIAYQSFIDEGGSIPCTSA